MTRASVSADGLSNRIAAESALGAGRRALVGNPALFTLLTLLDPTRRRRAQPNVQDISVALVPSLLASLHSL